MVAVNDVYELVMTWVEASSNTQCLNVFHFRQKAGFLSAINLIGEFRAGVETEFRAIPASGVAIQKYSCRSLIPYNTDFYETTLTPTLPGTGGSNTCPMGVAVLMTWRTGLPGRRKRGRSYIAGISLNNTTGGRLFPTFITNQMAALGNKFLTLWAPGGSSPTTEYGVWSRMNAGPDPPFALGGFQAVTGFTPQSALGTMGTRRSGRGI